MVKKQNFIPKVGDQIYIDTSLYVTHGIDDFIGGLCEVEYVKIDENGVFIAVKEEPGAFYDWKYLSLEQGRLKKQFGKKRGYQKPDFRQEFNEL